MKNKDEGWFWIVVAVFLLTLAFHNIDNAWNLGNVCYDGNLLFAFDRSTLYGIGVVLLFVSAMVFLTAYSRAVGLF